MHKLFLKIRLNKLRVRSITFHKKLDTEYLNQNGAIEQLKNLKVVINMFKIINNF